MDCGPTCLKMIAAYYGKDCSLDFLRAHAHITRNGVSLSGISEAAEQVGFRPLSVKITYEQLIKEAPLPCILHWNREHFVVLYQVRAKRFGKPAELLVADPDHDLVRLDKETFLRSWISTAEGKGVALLLEPTPDFYNRQQEKKTPSTGFNFLFRYLTPYKRYLLQIVLGMLFGSFISLLFPLLTQNLVDRGIQAQDMDYVHLILFSQLLLFLGSMGIDIIRNWILLHINTRLSVSIISNFLIKLMKLPISFFESKNLGDISQRINDHRRIEDFLTGSTLTTMFSLINIIIFSLILGAYDLSILLVFLIGSILSVAWIFLFIRQRKSLDYRRFQQHRANQNNIFELITGMQEIKINNCEQPRRWAWEATQAKLFKINVKNLALEQYQEVGSTFFNQLKNILISYAAAKLVIDQQISLGAMLSISYIIGQMNSPLNQIIGFVKKVQDAKISLDRLGEIHNRENEEIDEEFLWRKASSTQQPLQAVACFRDKGNMPTKGIVLQNVSFRYGGPTSPLVLDNLSLHIPKGKVTAIVGASGSGKTTLLKLLLKFYPLSSGDIFIDNQNIKEISARKWRQQCGTVMQDGYIFSDTIAANIAVDGQYIDENKMRQAVRVANIKEYIESLALGFTTRIGNTGTGLSGGQRQRLFIARAVYKDPQFILFDEATSALDANNEKIIMQNLEQFFKGKTVVVIAHRLSTVKNADQIIVLDKGRIQEIGTHQELVEFKDYYYELIKNQLELGAA